MEAQRYCVITPCRDEARFGRRTLDSMVAQTIRPALWVIVDDGSTDGTPALLAEYTARHDWIRVVRREDRGKRSVGPGVIDAFYAGLETVDLSQFDFICKLDLDLDLPAQYFERQIERMAKDPRLGTCSGKAYFLDSHGQRVFEETGNEVSIGAAKFYRVACFRQIGGFVRQVMWDGIDCHRCRMTGWKAASWGDVPELQFEHLRPMGSSHKGILTGRRRHGFGQYFMGSSFVYLTASAAYRLTRPPMITGGLAIWWGFVSAWLTGKAQYDDAEFRRFVRRYQWKVLLQGKARAVAELEAELADRWHPDDHNGGDAGPGLAAAGAGSAPTVELDGVPFAAVTEKQAVADITAAMDDGRGGWVVPMNLDVLRQWHQNPEVPKLCGGADVFVADGMPLLWAAWLRGTPLPERVCGSNLIFSLSEAARQRGRSVFLLGGDPGTADAAAQRLGERYPGLRVVGTFCPPMGFDRDEDVMGAMTQKIVSARPDIVFVALGFPKQERLIRRLREHLPQAWWMGVGISFSFVCGRVKRAPRWMQRMGLEWIHRLLQEPRRLARRYLLEGLPFAVTLLCRSLLARGTMHRSGGPAAT